MEGNLTRARRTVADRPRRAVFGDAEVRAVDHTVQREVHGDVVAERGERLRERAHDVGEAADLRVGGDLGGREDDAHGDPNVSGP